MKIDLPPVGPSGIEARTWAKNGTRYCYVAGSDHWRDWLHHVTPGAKRREIEAAATIAGRLYEPGVSRYVIGGHSLGGAVAEAVACNLRAISATVECYTFGGKRSPLPFAGAVHYRNRGDIIPFLPPWRTPHSEDVLIGRWTLWFWKAHSPRTYDEVRRKHGLK